MIEVEAPAAAPIWAHTVDDLLAEAVRFHGHLCPGLVLGVRMTMAGCRETGFGQPRAAGKGRQAAGGTCPQVCTIEGPVKVVSGSARCRRQSASVAAKSASAISPRSSTRARSDSTVAGR